MSHVVKTHKIRRTLILIRITKHAQIFSGNAFFCLFNFFFFFFFNKTDERMTADLRSFYHKMGINYFTQAENESGRQ